MSICMTDVFQELIDKAMDDYELIEEFYYNLSTDDFNAKYVSFLSLLFLPSPWNNHNGWLGVKQSFTKK